MSDQDLRQKLVEAAFDLGAQQGWARVSPAAAARHGGLDLVQARRVFPCTAAILREFGREADQFALTGALTEGSVRDRLFDIVLRRFDYLQARRAGVLRLLKALPGCPPLAAALAEMSLTSMGWLLEGAGVDATGLSGAVKKRALLGVWLYAARAWAQDESHDLTGTMAAVDKGLAKLEELALRFMPGQPVAPAQEASPIPETPIE